MSKYDFVQIGLFQKRGHMGSFPGAMDYVLRQTFSIRTKCTTIAKETCGNFFENTILPFEIPPGTSDRSKYYRSARSERPQRACMHDSQHICDF